MRFFYFSLIILSFYCHLALAKTLVYCSEGSPSSFNPQLTTDGTSNNASSHTIYNTLVQFKYGETTIEPSLAEKWEISKDGLKYKFFLRKNVKFHSTDYFKPTRDFNADDVLFSFNRQRKSDHPYYLVGGGTYEYFKAMEMDKLIKDIKKIDDYTVEFILNYPESPFIANLSMGFSSILSSEYAEKLQKENNKEKMDMFPIGTGPFVYKSYNKDSLIRFEAHPNYFEGKVKIDKLIFAITPDSHVRFQKLKGNECHFIAEPSPQDIEQVKNDPKLTVMKAAGLNIGYVAFNTKKKPFDNILVRKAMNHAINKDSYLEAIYLNQAIKAINPIPPTMWSYNNSIKGYEYNVEKAKELMKQAGYANGFSVDLWTLPVSRPYNPNGKKMGELIQADLAKIGIKIKLVTYDWPTYLSKSRTGEHEMIQMGWTGDNGDPDNFLGILLSCAGIKVGSNYSQWCNSAFDKLILEAKKLTNKNEREKKYRLAQEIVNNEVPWIPIAHATTFRVFSSKIKNYKIDPFGGDVFSSVDITD